MGKNILYFDQEKDVWEKSQPWMQFFYHLGRYIQTKDNIQLYISFVDYLYPGVLISLGVIDKYYEEVAARKRKIVKELKDELRKGSDIAVRRKIGDEYKWMKASDVQLAYIKYFEENQLEFEIKRAGQPPIKTTTSYKNWLDNVRINGNYTKTAGEIVKLNDDSSSLEKNKDLSLNQVKYLLMFNRNIINFYGHNLENQLNIINESILFENGKERFKLDEYILFEKNGYNYRNARIIKSKKDTGKNDEGVSIYFGAKTALRYNDFNHKSVILTTRKHYDLEPNNILFSNLKSDLIHNKSTLNDDITEYFEEIGIELPKGVDFFGY